MLSLPRESDLRFGYGKGVNYNEEAERVGTGVEPKSFDGADHT